MTGQLFFYFIGNSDFNSGSEAVRRGLFCNSCIFFWMCYDVCGLQMCFMPSGADTAECPQGGWKVNTTKSGTQR